MKESVDITVIGGGGSGLALLYAFHLQGLLKHNSVLLLESEEKNDNDRTWCFWTDQEDPAWQMFSPCVSKTWTKAEGPFEGKQSMAPYHYAQIRSKDYYHFVNEALSSYDHFERSKAKVIEVSGKEPLVIKLEDGSLIESQYVFDSRPPKASFQDLIWQSFVGYRIRTESQIEDIHSCRLMDFEVPQENGLQFMYWLPTSENEALIEFTRFGKEILSEEESKPIIESYLADLGIQKFEILEKEIEKIPMTQGLNAKKKHYSGESYHIAIGARAGAIKASSGFAFKYFIEHAWNLSKAFKSKRPLPTLHHPLRFQVYDELLMRLITERKDLIKLIFERLFQKHPLPRIFRFLDEKSRFDEEFQIMYSMPWLPFFWSIKKSLLKRFKDLVQS